LGFSIDGCGDIVDSRNGVAKLLLVGKIYRLKFPGIAARVIEPPPGVVPGKFPYLVESLFLRSRWWVNELGEPDNIYSPLMITPAGRAALAGRRPVSQSKVLQ
jgi:hypothetical protein